MLENRHPKEGVRAEIGELGTVEALRGIAVLLVILFHYIVVRDPRAGDPWIALAVGTRPLEVVLRNGYLGVDLFFLISGFLLVLPWGLHASGSRPLPRARDFYVRRIRRIVPAYYVHLLFLFLFFLPFLHGVRFFVDHAGLVAYNAAAHALFLHYFTPISSASLGLNGPLWTLALEAQFYLLLPLLAPRFVRSPLAWCALLVAISAAWRWLAAHDLAAMVSGMMALGARWDVAEGPIRHLLLTQLPGYIGHFAVGMGLGLAWLRLREVAPSLPRQLAWIALLAGSLALMYWAYGLGGGAVLGPLGSWIATLAALGASFLAIACGGGLASRALERPTLMFVGRTSYSAYLYHLPLLLAWNQLRVLDGSWLSLPAYLFLVLCAAYASHRFIELRFMRPPSQPERKEQARRTL